MAGLSAQQRKTHHEVSPALLARIEQNVMKLTKVMQDMNPFIYEGHELINIVTKSVVPEDIKEDILSHEQCGKAAYISFTESRLIGETNLWDKMSKLKLQTWTSTEKTTTVNVGSQTIELKEN